MDGLVKMFDSRRGFGFITPLIGSPDTAEDVWFHVGSVRDEIRPPRGARVSFRIVDAPGGRIQAADIRIYERTIEAQERRRARNLAERQESYTQAQ